MRILISWVGTKGFPHQSIVEIDTLADLDAVLKLRGVQPVQVKGVREVKPTDYDKAGNPKFEIINHVSLAATPPRE